MKKYVQNVIAVDKMSVKKYFREKEEFDCKLEVQIATFNRRLVVK